MQNSIKVRSFHLNLFTALAITVILSGCAATRSVVTLDQPTEQIGNPDHGVAIKIVKVTDARIFEASPKQPDTPSLSSDDINNPSIKDRAIGRKRSGFGMAMGDVLLPEGETVSSIFEHTIASSFREANYRVLEEGDNGYASALPVQAKITQYWSWFNPGFLEVKVSNKSEVKFTSSIPGLKNGTVLGEVSEGMMAVTEDDWQAIASKGLKNFSQNLKKKLEEK